MTDIAKIVVDIEVTGTKEASASLQELKQVGQELETSRHSLGQGWLDKQLSSSTKFYQELNSATDYFQQTTEGTGQILSNQLETNFQTLKSAQTDLNQMSIGFEESIRQGAKRMDNMGFNLFKNWIVEGKSALSGLKDFFKNWLAEMAYTALAKPIVLQITAGIASSLSLGQGLALANGQEGGNNSLFNNASSFIPDSWKNSASDFFSNLFGMGGGSSALTNGSGTVSSLMAPGGSLSNIFGSGSQFVGPMQSATASSTAGNMMFGTAAGYGALGSIGYSTLGKAIGLPQGKYSGIGAGIIGTGGAMAGSALASSSLMAGSGMATGAAFGSVIPIVGTAVGAILGGVLGSVIGGGKKTKPSTYTGISAMPLDDTAWDYSKFFEAGAWYDRTSPESSQDLFKGLGDVAKSSVDQVKDLAKALPEEYSQSVLENLSKQTWSAGRNSPGSVSEWNFQGHNMEEMFVGATLDIQANILAAFSRSLEGIDTSKLGVDLDLSSFAGVEKAMQGLSAIKDLGSAIDLMLEPMSEMEVITNQVNAQFDGYKKELEALGVQAWKVAEIDARRAEVLEKALEPMKKAFEQEYSLRQAQLSQGSNYVAQLQYTIQQEAELSEAIKTFGKESAQVALLTLLQAEEMAKYIEDLAASNAKYARETLAMRQAQIDGNENAIASLRLMLSHEQELAEARQRFGEQDPFIGQLEWIQAQEKYQLELAQYQATMAQYQAEVAARNAETERLRAAHDQAKSAFFGELQAELNRMQQEASQAKQNFYNALQAEQSRLQSDVDKSRSALVSGLEKEKSRLEAVIEASKKFSESLNNLHDELWTDSRLSILGQTEQTNLTEHNLQELYTQALAGDQAAYGKFETASKDFLQKSIEANADFNKYQADFLRVQQMINTLTDKSSTGLSVEEQQLAAIKSELASMQTAEKTLAELRADYATANKALQEFNGSYFQYLSEINASQLQSLESLKEAMLSADNRLADFNTKYSAYIGQLGTSIVNKLEELRAAYLQTAADLKNQLAKPPVSQPGILPPTAPPPTAPTLPDLKPDKPKTMLDILQAKVDTLNKDGSLTPQQTVGNWTVVSLLELIHSRGFTAERWYEQFGKAEGYARGGLPVVGAWSLVGEEGPELVNFSQPSRVYTAKDTLNMLNSSLLGSAAHGMGGADFAGGSSRSARADREIVQALAELKTENKTLRLQINQILSSINSNTRRISDTVEAWDVEGQPKERLQ